MAFFEIVGESVSDLLNTSNSVQLLPDKDENMHPFPLVEPVVRSAEGLLDMIKFGVALRSSAATGVNDASSRSHAILRIYINFYDAAPADGPPASDSAREGVLTLVDLAGSEYDIDSMYHSVERRKESAGINANLSALKDFLRSRAHGGIDSAVYKDDKLTMALKSSFTMEDAATTVLACVSPASKDTEHALGTLRHALVMSGQVRDPKAIGGGFVNKQDIGEINVTQVARDKKAKGGELKANNGYALHCTALHCTSRRCLHVLFYMLLLSFCCLFN